MNAIWVMSRADTLTRSYIAPYLPAIMLASSVYFQAAMDFVLLILGIVVLLNWSIVVPSVRRIFAQQKKIIVLFFLLFLWTAFATILAPSFEWMDLKVLTHFQNFIHIILLAALLIAEDNQENHYLLNAQLILSLAWLPAAYGIYRFFEGYDPLFQRDTSRLLGSLNSATYHSHNMSLVLSFVTPAAIWWLSELIEARKKIFLRIFLLFSYGVCLLSVYLTYTRGAWLGLAVGLFISFLRVQRNGLKMALFAISGVTLVLMALFDSRFLSRWQESLNSASDAARKSLLQAHLDMFVERPLLGHGYMQYQKEFVSHPYTEKYPAIASEDLKNSHAHNQYLQMLSSLGLVGLLLFLALVGYFCYLSFKLPKHSNDSLLLRDGVWAFLSTMLVLFLTDQTFEYFLSRESISVVWSLIISQVVKKDLG